MKERTSKGVGKTLEAWRTSEDIRIKMEAQTGSTLFQFRTPGTAVLKLTPMSHTESDLDVLYMDGKIISRSFQWNRFQDQIHPESTGIVCTS
jgi:hypothetical protein